MRFLHRREVDGPVPRREEAVDHTRAAARGQVDGQAFAAERLHQAREQRLQVEVPGVDPVHHHHAREPALRRRLHHAPGDHLHPLPRVHHHRRGLHRREDRQRPAEEVGVAGGIDEVHVPGAVVEVRYRAVQGMLVLLLLGIEVAHRGAVRDAPGRTDDACVCEQRLDQGRLAGAAVPDQGHVADVVGGVLGHGRDPPCRLLPPSVVVAFGGRCRRLLRSNVVVTIRTGDRPERGSIFEYSTPIPADTGIPGRMDPDRPPRPLSAGPGGHGAPWTQGSARRRRRPERLGAAEAEGVDGRSGRKPPAAGRSGACRCRERSADRADSQGTWPRPR